MISRKKSRKKRKTAGDATKDAQDGRYFPSGSVVEMDVLMYHCDFAFSEGVLHPSGKVKYFSDKVLKIPHHLKGRIIGVRLGFDKATRKNIGLTAEVLSIAQRGIKLRFLQRCSLSYSTLKNVHYGCDWMLWFRGPVHIEECDFHSKSLCSSRTQSALNIVERVLFERVKNLCKAHMLFDDALPHGDDATLFSHWLYGQLPFEDDELNVFLGCRCNINRLMMCIDLIEKFVRGALCCKQCGHVLAAFKDRMQLCMDGIDVGGKKILSNRFYHKIGEMKFVPFCTGLADLGHAYWIDQCPVEIVLVRQQKYAKKDICCQNYHHLGYSLKAVDPDDSDLPEEMYFLNLNHFQIKPISNRPDN